MGFLSAILGIVGFGIGIPVGLFVGFFFFFFFFFVYSDPEVIKDPIVKPLVELDSCSLLNLLPEIPLWVKNPDYERVDWMNRFILDMWPYLHKAICDSIRSIADPIFADYIGKFFIKSIEFERLNLGSLPPTIQGIKVQETNENSLIIDPAVRWAGNPDVTVVLKFRFIRVTIQLTDLQILAALRIVLKPLVPAFPCFASIKVSLMEKPQIDFGLKLLGGDIMAIPGLYQFVQEIIRKQVASLYLWPLTLEIPILDGSIGAVKRPVGILHVKVLRAQNLLKMDVLGTSDPYVELSLSGEMLPAKKTSIKRKNLNPVWNEDLNLIVKDPHTQILQMHVYDWEKVGTHDKLGMQVVPLRLLSPCATKKFTLQLMKNNNVNDPQNKKQRGQIVVELTYNPFKDDDNMGSGVERTMGGKALYGAGLLLVMVQGAEDVEGKHHTNPYALIILRGEERKTKIIKKTRDPSWNEEFEFMLEEAPLREILHIEVKSKRRLSFHSKESLGHVDINLMDVVTNGRINEKYHLINSRHGVIHLEVRWKTI